MARPKGHGISPEAWNDLITLRGYSLTEVAARANIQRATLSAITNEHARASIPVAHALANALGCHPETLFPTLRPKFAEAA